MHDRNPIIDYLHSESPLPRVVDTVPENPLRRRLRIAFRMLVSLLLGAAATVGAIVVFRQGLLPLVNSAFNPGPEALSAIRRAGILLSAIAGYWAHVHWHEKRDVSELRPRPAHLLLGAASGAALVALPVAVLFALGAYELIQFRGISPSLLGVAAIIGIAATLEELLYRCLLFRVLERAWGTVAALLIQSAVFAIAHLENVEKGKASDIVMMLVSVTLLGIFWAGIFVRTRNLWVAAANHAAWNFTILLCGTPLSGIEDWRSLSPLETRYAGPDWLTGGMFGPENSLLVILSVFLAVALLLRGAHRQGAFIQQGIGFAPER
ncbi:MAG TPA: type II CAAX endopeptidase family protein [Thermoanaerobaculia bacterium]